MICIYDSKEINFNDNGIIMNEWINIKVTECLNGEYSMLGIYPISDSMKYKELIKGAILMLPTPTGEQPFRIFSVERSIDEISVEGFHIFYDLNGNNIPSNIIINGSGDTAIKEILKNCENKHNFLGYSNIKDINKYEIKDSMSPLNIFFREPYCVINIWDGELYRDKFKIGLLDRIGIDTNIEISYGKNLVNFQNNSSFENIVTKINATYNKIILDSEGNEITSFLSTTVCSPLIDDYAVIYTKNISVNNEDNLLDINDENDLYNYIYDFYFIKNNIDKPRFSVSVDWIKVNEYEDLKLGDTAIIIHEKYDFRYRLKITKYIYDCISCNYEELSFGDLDGQIENVMANQGSNIEGINNAISNHSSNIYELNKRFYDLENPIYYPNAVYNSNFGRVNEFGIPDYWDTNGSVTTLNHLLGEYSLMLTKDQYLKMKEKPIECYKWENYSTSFTFRVIGNGRIKVKVLADENEMEIFKYENDNYISSNEFLINIDSMCWFDSKYSIELHPCKKVVKLSVECIEGKIYMDAIQVVPILQGSRLNILYIDGPKCYNDVMKYREDDLLNAKVGDMWFRRDL